MMLLTHIRNNVLYSSTFSMQSGVGYNMRCVQSMNSNTILTLTEATHRKEVLRWQLHQSLTGLEEKEKSVTHIPVYKTHSSILY